MQSAIRFNKHCIKISNLSWWNHAPHFNLQPEMSKMSFQKLGPKKFWRLWKSVSYSELYMIIYASAPLVSEYGWNFWLLLSTHLENNLVGSTCWKQSLEATACCLHTEHEGQNSQMDFPLSFPEGTTLPHTKFSTVIKVSKAKLY